MSHRLPRLLLLGLIALALAGAAESPGRLGMVTTLVGDATVARGGATPRAIAFKDEVLEGDVIRTAPHGLVRVLLRGATLVAIGENSTAGLTTDAAGSTVRLDAGTVSVVVGGDKPAPLAIRTPHGTASLRGTSVIAQLAGSAVTFYVLSGIAHVTPPVAGGAVVVVNPLQFATVQGRAVGPVAALSKERVASLMKDFRPVPPHPDAPQETVKAVGDRGQSEVEKEELALRQHGLKGLPKTDDLSRPRIIVPPPTIPAQSAPKGCC